jgi:hypothetical protein
MFLTRMDEKLQLALNRAFKLHEKQQSDRRRVLARQTRSLLLKPLKP